MSRNSLFLAEFVIRVNFQAQRNKPIAMTSVVFCCIEYGGKRLQLNSKCLIDNYTSMTYSDNIDNT